MLLEQHPFWVLLAFALLGGAAVLLLRARTRPTGNSLHCMTCGYDLTGLISDRCPECGAGLSEDTCVIGSPSEMRWGVFSLGGLLLFLGVSIVAILAQRG